ncbi:MAG: glycerate kinase [Cytophagales bacterium]|nr:glycerate kinase [Cytophagales bacterium]
MPHKEDVIEIFCHAVNMVKPDTLMANTVYVADNILYVNNIHCADLSTFGNIYITGAGKAVSLMAAHIENILGNRVYTGQIIPKYHHSIPLKKIIQTEASHPIPDENSVIHTLQIINVVQKLGSNDLVIMLISGGGSALMTDLPPFTSLDNIKQLSQLLLSSGADIHEINCVRKHISQIKGGGFARLAYPANIVSIILSDVIGNSLSVIASGLTAPDSTTYSDALDILEKYKITAKVPAPILTHLLHGKQGVTPETPKSGDKIFDRVKNHIIGSNLIALKYAKSKAETLGYEAVIVTDTLCDDVEVVADIISHTLLQAKVEKPTCFIFGGEPTVSVTGTGLGGRNQHLAMLMAAKIDGKQNITFLSAGTDGTDGPTNAAGAVVNYETTANSTKQKIDIQNYITNNDSYHYFSKAGGHLFTGPTQTNVMDIMLGIVTP